MTISTTDVSAWRRIEREIRRARGAVSLAQFLQEMELRSKEPVPEPGAVSLSTIHGAKGLEFDRVYLIGLAEEVLPSWHSIKNANENAAPRGGTPRLFCGHHPHEAMPDPIQGKHVQRLAKAAFAVSHRDGPIRRRA